MGVKIHLSETKVKKLPLQPPIQPSYQDRQDDLNHTGPAGHPDGQWPADHCAEHVTAAEPSSDSEWIGNSTDTGVASEQCWRAAAGANPASRNSAAATAAREHDSDSWRVKWCCS